MKDKKKRLNKVIIITIVTFIIVVSVSYSFINLTLDGSRRQVITAGNLSLKLDEDENNLTITNALPMYDEVGMIQDAFTFALTNNTTVATDYTIKLDDITISNNKLDTNIVKYGLTKNGVDIIDLLSNLNDGVIDSGTIKTIPIEYELRFWIDSSVTENSQIQNKTLSYRIIVEAIPRVVYKDESGANVPELTSGMIPVTYDGVNWVKADTTKKWYDYNEQWWANAVTVTESTRVKYTLLDTGEAINMDDINTMWVWIPRYEYQYTNLGEDYAGGTQASPGEIKINFISKDVIVSSDDNVYKIPEGFTFGDENISGFWMGKFETTGEIINACESIDCTTANLTIKPNLPSVTSQVVSSYFYASRSMQNKINASKYGFDEIGTSSMDVHMLKNTEWGIVAYLSQSKYGKYGNSNYSDVNKKIYANKSDTYVTGMSNQTSSLEINNEQVPYDTVDTGYGASTTGTIYGVYDMNGGTYEFVMANLNNYSGSTIDNNSGFAGLNPKDSTTTVGFYWPDRKYYDLYLVDDISVAYKNADATYEVATWYNEGSVFVSANNPWMLRGGSYDYSNSSVFSFVRNGGFGYVNNGFRIAIKP